MILQWNKLLFEEPGKKILTGPTVKKIEKDTKASGTGSTLNYQMMLSTIILWVFHRWSLNNKQRNWVWITISSIGKKTQPELGMILLHVMQLVSDYSPGCQEHPNCLF